MNYDEYVVKEGDTIVSIAKLYGVRIIDIITANGLEDVYYLEPGQVLKIPTNYPLALEEYRVVSGDTLYKISNMYNISVADLAAINGLELDEYIYPNQVLLVPRPGVSIYITKEGDTIEAVAGKLNLPQGELFLYNNRIFLLPDQLIAYKNNREM